MKILIKSLGESINVFKIQIAIELKKLLIHNLMVES